MRSFFGVHKIIETTDGQFRSADARHDRARRPAHPRRRGRADRRPARAADLLPRQLADRARHRGRARAQGRPDPPGDRGARRRQAPPACTEPGDTAHLLRDRSGGGGDRAGSEAVHLSGGVRAGHADRRWAMPGSRSPTRPTAATTSSGRRVHLRRHAGPPDDQRGDGDLSQEARAQRHRR